MLCALATHAAVYRSLWPAGGDHGYLIWYAPLVAGLSGVSIVVLPLVLALAVAGRRDSGPLRALSGLVTRGVCEPELVTGTLTLASQALVFLFVQESLERSLEKHGVAVASFSPSTWAVLLTVIVTTAGAVATLYAIPTDDRLNHRVDVLGGVRAAECAALLSAFFAELRRQ